MKMRFRGVLLAGLLAASLLSAAPALASRLGSPLAADGGTVTGQIVWCTPVPLPYGAPNQSDEAVPAEPPAIAPEPLPESGGVMPGMRVPYPRLVPAGAVLVAVQGTALSARTDESGRFRITGVPTGQYLTIAAGPVRGISSAVVLRPNVFIQREGDTVDLGRLSLGQPCSYGPYPLPAVPQEEPGMSSAPTMTPEPNNTPY